MWPDRLSSLFFPSLCDAVHLYNTDVCHVCVSIFHYDSFSHILAHHPTASVMINISVNMYLSISMITLAGSMILTSAYQIIKKMRPKERRIKSLRFYG